MTGAGTQFLLRKLSQEFLSRMPPHRIYFVNGLSLDSCQTKAEDIPPAREDAASRFMFAIDESMGVGGWRLRA
jgi:hypothetical protein